LGSDKVRSAQARFRIAPVENRTCPFEGIRLNTCGQSPWGYHEASVPISPAPQAFTRGQLARSLGTLVSIFPKARGLRHQSSSCCRRLSRPPTTTPHPPLPEASEFRWGLPSLLPTLLRIRQAASRVHHVGLKRDGVGSAFLMAPSALCGLPVPAWGTQVQPGSLPGNEACIPGRTILA
jgi:hypothetical protein